MAEPVNVLIFGASYGSLLATRLAMAGHGAQLVCLPEEAERVNREGTRVRIPVRGRDAPVEVDSRRLPGRVSAVTPREASPGEFDLIGLAMQEPQYGAPEVRALLARVGASRRPCMSIMNMPPLAFLRRIPGLDAESLRDCYTDASVWDALDPALVTLASPDPQAFRPPEEPVNVLQVGLPTNFKVAPFEGKEPTALLRRLEADIEKATWDPGDGPIRLPVKLRVHESIYVPLAKWAMLLTGNYRCVGEAGMSSIREAVHGDLATSRDVYEWVCTVCEAIGASRADLVPFEKYAEAALGLQKPSSAARALAAGAKNIERVDRLVQRIGADRGLRHPVVEETVRRVDAWLERNR